MANKTFNTRIKNKRDTSANWTSKDPVLLNGEIIIVDTASGETRFKIGDGAKKYSQLPFQDEAVRALIDSIPSDTVQYTPQTLTDSQQSQARTNIGAISEAELVQPDWNQNDETAKDYIKNRICYEEETVTELGNTFEIWQSIVGKDANGYYNTSAPISYRMKGKIYKNLTGNVQETFRCVYNTSSQTSYLLVKADDTKYSTGTLNFPNGVTADDFQFVKVENTVKQIDKKFIPDEAFTQADWNENDESSPAYIQNRICYEETGEDKTYTLTPNKTNSTWNFTNGDIPLVLGQTAIVKSNGGSSATFTGTVTQDSDGELCIDATSIIPITVYSNTATYMSQWISNAAIKSITVTIGAIVVHQIDPKYIPTLNELNPTNITPVNSQAVLTELNMLYEEILTGFVSARGSQDFTNSQKAFARSNIGALGAADIDTVLSSTSENAVQNKVVKAAIEEVQSAVDSKVDTTSLNYGLNQVTNDVAANYVKFTAEQTLTDEQKAQARENINAPSPADAVYTVTASSTDGVAYTATVSGIDSLTVGASFIMIPNKASTSKAPTLNVNGLGAKPIRRRLSSLTTSLQQGYSANWIALNKPFTVVYDGAAWIVEGLTKTDGADVYGAVAQATADANGNNIVDTYATIAMLQSLLPKVTTITLTTSWTGSTSPYYQDIALSCATETSIVDLQPTPEQLASWQDEGLAFTTLSGNGTVRVYVAGGKPNSAITVQVRVQEVTVI